MKSKRLKGMLIRYTTTAFFAAGMVVLFLLLNDYSAGSSLEKLRMLCDAFTIPAVLLLGLGCLIAISNEGALDGIAYCLKRLGLALIPGGRLRMGRFADYVEARRAKRVKGYLFLLISGAILLAVAVGLLVLFNSAYAIG